MGHSKGSAKGKVYSLKCICKNPERSQTNDLMLHLQLLTIQEEAKAKTSRRKDKIKIRSKINEIETEKTYKDSTK
jgi:hypothetical protein